MRFQLRTGVQFHDGKGEFTSKDVKRVWQELAREDSKFAQSEYWRRIVKDVDTPSPHEVAFHLNQPDANFIHALSEAEAGMEMWSSADLNARGAPSMQGSPLAGTGPYQFC